MVPIFLPLCYLSCIEVWVRFNFDSLVCILNIKLLDLSIIKYLKTWIIICTLDFTMKPFSLTFSCSRGRTSYFFKHLLFVINNKWLKLIYACSAYFPFLHNQKYTVLQYFLRNYLFVCFFKRVRVCVSSEHTSFSAIY